MHGFFLLNSAKTFWGAKSAFNGAVEHSKTNWRQKLEQEKTQNDLDFDSVRHVIIIPQYREDLATVTDTLRVLASHSMAITHYSICLGMEQADPEGIQKAETLIDRFEDQFFDIFYTNHPMNIPGEVRGKSSNVAWAATKVARRFPLENVMLTVMDADTCFAQDYFLSLNYYYCAASPVERKILFFSPTTLFDRNSDRVPFIVRCADRSWSLGVMSNQYPESTVKLPCSAYSIPLELAVNVGLWDTDETAMGEDFHMYVKCFFATQGTLVSRAIYSPASCCNIQGISWWDSLRSRISQAKRHMWASLEIGYVLRRSLFGFVAPRFDAPKNKLVKVPIATRPDIVFDPLEYAIQVGHLLYRTLEANVFMGQVFFLIATSTVLIPVGENPSYVATWFWESLTTTGVHPFVELSLYICSWIRIVAATYSVLAFYFYEKYHTWCAHTRWSLSNSEIYSNGVQPLGIRPALQSKRSVKDWWDWIALPIAGVLFLTAPQAYCQIAQLYTNKLDYKVAAKPTLETEMYEVDDTLSRGDSGFYDSDSVDSISGRHSPHRKPGNMLLSTVPVVESIV